jgi:hypothetical protein
MLVAEEAFVVAVWQIRFAIKPVLIRISLSQSIPGNTCLSRLSSRSRHILFFRIFGRFDP